VMVWVILYGLGGMYGVLVYGLCGIVLHGCYYMVGVLLHGFIVCTRCYCSTMSLSTAYNERYI
jgi:hypothetical protein